jgi:hypothetical protein
LETTSLSARPRKVDTQRKSDSTRRVENPLLIVNHLGLTLECCPDLLLTHAAILFIRSCSSNSSAGGGDNNNTSSYY